ncbi:stage III sporulation protein AC [Tepidibacter thalassicus]|uniref:Stage III sporulation protein AC n=1 Tax=Tepidibacter thalassicus DSM 15285 TaxID=1123350 RepID=A0A1M5Q530_9FIRM|nr:stage III sporulation protein AC [Tepidibacter thalassicus]SHH08960.1 stage III sporulation protein AC [Tepidibacter thalassicus DSM 15285]
MGVNVDLIFKIGGIGILLSVLHSVLQKAGKEEWAYAANLVGIVLVLTMVIKEVSNLFDAVKTMFNLY